MNSTIDSDSIPFLTDPFARLYTGENNKLHPCFLPDGPFDLNFGSNKRGIRSKIPSLSIGDVRQSFIQLRNLEERRMLSPDTPLSCGLTAGQFSLKYICMTYIQKRNTKKRSNKNNNAPQLPS